MYDVIVIGGGIIGCNILYNLSRFNLNAVLLEANEDLSAETTKANSGIIHAGYDCKTGTRKARFNFEGNKKMYALCKYLGVPHKKTGSLVLGNKQALPELAALLKKGEQNGIEGLKIIERNEILKIEPNVADDIEYALFAPSAGIVSPYLLALSLAEFAVLNGARVRLNERVCAISRLKNAFAVSTAAGSCYKAKVVINAAGGCAADVNKLIGAETFSTKFRRGDYHLLDSSEYGFVRSVCFQPPSKAGKGVLLAPTADGNVIVGPTAIDTTCFDDTATQKDALDYIKLKIAESFKNVKFNKTIRVFAGVRAICGEDFEIAESKLQPNFIYAAGICSPGLTSAPAIADYITGELLSKTVLGARAEKTKFKKPAPQPVVKGMDAVALNALIKKDPAYGRIVCACESITEGEITAACLRDKIPPTTLDGLKRRLRAGMGRCQGGFCTEKIIKIMAKALKVPVTKISKCGEGSEIAVSREEKCV
jgi:glycerol-3-phosphate dehydrogenase